MYGKVIGPILFYFDFRFIAVAPTPQHPKKRTGGALVLIAFFLYNCIHGSDKHCMYFPLQISQLAEQGVDLNARFDENVNPQHAGITALALACATNKVDVVKVRGSVYHLTARREGGARRKW